jgi:hypothetical protein
MIIGCLVIFLKILFEIIFGQRGDTFALLAIESKTGGVPEKMLGTIS